MKKSIIFLQLIFPLLFYFNAQSQGIALGVRGGISIPNLTAGSGNENPLNTGYTSRQGPDFGVFGEYRVSALFSIQLMIEYSAQGGKKKGMQALPVSDELTAMFPPGQVPQYLYANYNSTAKLNYLMLPILAKFGYSIEKTSLRIYTDAGPFIGYLISAKQVTSGKSQLYFDPSGQQLLPVGQQSFDNTDDIKSQLHPINIGIEGNIGLNYRIGRSNVFVEVGGNYGFLNIQKGMQNGKNNTGAATAVLGYNYEFRR